MCRGALTFNVNQLTTASGFAALETVGGNLSISSNSRMTTPPAFASLKSVGKNSGNGFINIQGNGALETLSGFDALTSIEGRLQISGHTSLTTVSGFGAITSTSSLNVFDNGQLSECCGLIRFVDGTIPTGGRVIRDNSSDGGCNNVTEIADGGACATSEPEARPKLFTMQTSLSLPLHDVPAAVPTITRITGDLSISGTITSFPDFAALEVVEGNLAIDGITDRCPDRPCEHISFLG